MDNAHLCLERKNESEMKQVENTFARKSWDLACYMNVR